MNFNRRLHFNIGAFQNFTKPNNFSIADPKYKDQGTLVTNGLAISKDGLPVNHGDAGDMGAVGADLHL